MVGTGVFTSLGYQLLDIKSIFSLLMLWLIGGVISLFGAQNPELTKPLGDKIIVVNSGKECVHQRDHWRLCSSCMSAIDPESVYDSAVNLLRYNYGK